MALVSLPAPIPFPVSLPSTTTVETSVFLLNAASEAAALIANVPKTGTIDRLRFYAAVTTNATVQGEVQTVTSSTGNPSGTPVGTQGTVTTSGTGWYEITLGTGASVTQGEVYAFIVRQPSSSAGDMTVYASNAYWPTNRPYGALFASGSWAKSYYTPLIMVRYNDGTWVELQHLVGAHQITTDDVSQSTTPVDETGNRIDMVGTARVVGAEFFTNTWGGAFSVCFFDGSTEQEAKVVAPNISAAPSTLVRWAIYFQSSYTMTNGGVYRLTIRPTDTTSRPILRYNFDSNVIKPLGGMMKRTSRENLGAFSDTDGAMMGIVPIIDQIDNGAGGGGGLAALPIGGYVR